MTTSQPDSSLISRATQSAGSSPSSSFPPGSSHSDRSFSSSRTFPSWSATPLTETGKVCAAPSVPGPFAAIRPPPSRWFRTDPSTRPPAATA